MKKGKQNAEAAAWKLEPASTEATNRRKKEARKKQEEVDRRKAEAIAKKWRRDRGRSSLSIEDNGYYDNDTSGTDPDQEESLDPLESWNDSQIQIFVAYRGSPSPLNVKNKDSICDCFLIYRPDIKVSSCLSLWQWTFNFVSAVLLRYCFLIYSLDLERLSCLSLQSLWASLWKIKVLDDPLDR